MENFFKKNKILILILTGAFLASLAYSFYFRIELAVDARAYDNIAKNIIAGNGYREDLGGDIAQDNAITRVGPLYEFTLAGSYKIFGYHYEAVWILQALLHALTAWLLYLTCLLIFSANEKRKTIALLAAGIFAFYPDLIEISAMLMTETLYLFFVCLLFYVFFYYFSRPDKWRLALALGLIFGLAVLARPPVLFLAPVIIFLFWSKKKWLPLALCLIVLFLVFAPWTIRNYLTYGEIMPFGAAGNYNFWIGNWHGGDGEQNPQPFHAVFASTHATKEINSESMRQFKLFLREHPFEFLKLTALRVIKYFSIARPMGWWFYQAGIGQLLFVFSSALASIILFIFSLGGAIKAFMLREEKLNYLLALTIFTPLIIFVTVVETRYRFQIYPLLAIFAGYYMVDFYKMKHLDKYFWPAAVVILTNGFLDLILSWDKFKERIFKFF
ncbi:MAG: glycosyltransferase family 39 protein [bacterium]|nr:glycosyltransferase family 39 protein [bacterium]